MLELAVLQHICIKISAMSFRDYSLLLKELRHRNEGKTTPAKLRDDIPEGGNRVIISLEVMEEDDIAILNLRHNIIIPHLSSPVWLPVLASDSAYEGVTHSLMHRCVMVDIRRSEKPWTHTDIFFHQVICTPDFILYLLRGHL